MHDTNFLSQVVVVFGMAVLVVWLFRLVRAPSIIGFLITGIVIGPSTLGFIQPESVDQFAEIGLILLLFTVGLELSPQPLMRTGVGLLKATLIQVGLIAFIAVLVSRFALGAPWGASILLGIAVSLSSTAISLKQLSDRGEVQTAMGNLIVGMLLLQDVFVILVMVMLPLFTQGEGSSIGASVGAFAGLIAIVAGARAALPAIIRQLLGHGGQEMAALFAVMMAGGGAWLASLAGWSPALGACIAGLLLANADIRHQLVADITPFRDVFNALFFISMGMLVNTSQVLAHAPQFAVAVLLTIVIKLAVTAGAVRLAGWPPRIAFQVGFGLCTVSEFGYVLLHQAEIAGLVTPEFVENSVAYIVGSMMVGAISFPLGVQWSGRALVMFKQDEELCKDVEAEDEEALKEHVIIVGYGVNGENLVRVLKSTHIPYCVIEINPALVRRARADGAPVIMGDGTRGVILRHAGVRRARALVIGINDVQATRRIVSVVRLARPELHIVVHTQYVTELEELTKRGANIVVPADFEASVKIFSHVLEELDVPRNILAAQIAAVRAGDYGLFRGKSTGSQESLEDLLKVLQLAATQTFFLPETSPACGRSLRELDLRNCTGATVIAVVRDRVPMTSPQADLLLEAGDVIVLVGAHVQLAAARKLLEASSQLSPSPPGDETSS